MKRFRNRVVLAAAIAAPLVVLVLETAGRNHP